MYTYTQLLPFMKKVAVTPCFLRVSANSQVYSYGPSSKVKAMVPGTVQVVMTWALGALLSKGAAETAVAMAATAIRKVERIFKKGKCGENERKVCELEYKIKKHETMVLLYLNLRLVKRQNKKYNVSALLVTDCRTCFLFFFTT